MKVRICASVLIQHGMVVNRYNLAKHLPVGKPHQTLTRLGETEADEILLLNRSHGANPIGFINTVFEQLKDSPAALTPMAYGGGITDVKVAASVYDAGFERLVLSLNEVVHSSVLNDVTRIWGDQSVILHIPFYESDGNLYVKVRNQHFDQANFKQLIKRITDQYNIELLLTSVEDEGRRTISRDRVSEILNWTSSHMRRIYSGGLVEFEDILWVIRSGAEAVALGNLSNSKEMVIPRLKDKHPELFRPYIGSGTE